MVGMSMQTQRGDSLGRHQIQDRRPIRNDLQRRDAVAEKQNGRRDTAAVWF